MSKPIKCPIVSMFLLLTLFFVASMGCQRNKDNVVLSPSLASSSFQDGIGIDIKPQTCPNPLNTQGRGHGVIPVAILGSPEVDVHDIDPTSLIIEGVSALRSRVEDVATPVIDNTECSCTTEGPDGFDDLVGFFDRRDILGALGSTSDREVRALTLSGNFVDQRPFEASDCVIILGEINVFIILPETLFLTVGSSGTLLVTRDTGEPAGVDPVWWRPWHYNGAWRIQCPNPSIHLSIESV